MWHGIKTYSLTFDGIGSIHLTFKVTVAWLIRKHLWFASRDLLSCSVTDSVYLLSEATHGNDMNCRNVTEREPSISFSWSTSRPTGWVSSTHGSCWTWPTADGKQTDGDAIRPRQQAAANDCERSISVEISFVSPDEDWGVPLKAFPFMFPDHYCSQIRKHGPLRLLWTRRESK